MSLHQLYANFVYTFISFFSMLNPIGMSPVFLALTGGCNKEKRRRTAWKVAVNGSILLVCVFLVGIYVLKFFGISVGSLQVAGSLVLFSAAWSMLNQSSSGLSALHQHAEGDTDMSFFPLTMPITVGAGAIVVAIALAARLNHDAGGDQLIGYIGVILAILANLWLVGVVYAYSDRLLNLLGKSGTNALNRLTAFILLAISVEILWDGIKALIATLPR